MRMTSVTSLCTSACFVKHVGAFTVEPYSDLTYVSIASGVLHLYHFFFLQPVGMVRS